MSGTRGKCRSRRIALRLKAGESLAAEFVECLNGASHCPKAQLNDLPWLLAFAVARYWVQ